MSENKHLTLDERNFIEQELTKFYYRTLHSSNTYKTLFSESRQIINLTKLELSNSNRIASFQIKNDTLSLIFQKQFTLYTTLYNYISKNYLSVRNTEPLKLVKTKSIK